MLDEPIFLSPIKQIVVVKGWEGFADRLQVLSHCIEYCKKTGATICIDWRDSMWGQSVEDFHDYFKIVDIPSIPISSLLERINEITDISGNERPCKIFPPIWTIDTLLREPFELIHFSEYEKEINLSRITNYVEYDILVHNGKGNRTYHCSNIINNIRFQPDIREHIEHRLSCLSSIPSYTAIHLRGTDRLENRSIKNTLDKVYSEYEELDPFDKQHILIVTDMEELRVEILCRIPNADYILNPSVKSLPKNSKKGRHKLKPNVLKYYGIKKRDLILDSLTDFMVLCLSDMIISNQHESLFYKMSDLIRKYGGKEGAKSWLSPDQIENPID